MITLNVLWIYRVIFECFGLYLSACIPFMPWPNNQSMQSNTLSHGIHLGYASLSIVKQVILACF